MIYYGQASNGPSYLSVFESKPFSLVLLLDFLPVLWYVPV